MLLSPDPILEHFEKAAEIYDEVAGIATRAISRHIFSNLLFSPLAADSVVLDNCAGLDIPAMEIVKRDRKNHFPKQYMPPTSLHL